MSFKRTKVVMLSTNEKASLLLGTSKGGLLIKSNRGVSNSTHLKNQHLYLLSDDEIKEGDWFLEKGLRISIFPNYLTDTNECKKIIATTDKNLMWLDKSEKNPELARINGLWKCLPQPSESFIQKFIYAYNNGDPITEVMVEYNHLQSSGGLNEEWLKVNSSDNTITIRKMKDSWTREEVINLCREAINYGKDYNGNLSEKWIEYNL
jgi:hypothetical protein